MKRSLLTLSGSAGALAVALALGAQDGPTSVQAGVYNEEQAGRGAKVFSEACLVCHQPEEFSDGGYMEGWTGQSVNDFVDFIRSTMPEDNPGRLKRKQYIDVVSYFLQLNGVPAGETELERETLKQIQIEGPYGESSNE